MRLVLLLALAVACSGTSGVRDHSEALAVATHCQEHACPTTPEVRGLGDGCYVVNDGLYQCSTDELPAGQASCFEVPLCVGACEVTIRDGDGREISTKRCRDRWRADRDAYRPPLTCSPAQVEVAIGSTAAGSRSALQLPETLVREVLRTGKVKVWYEAETCATGHGVEVGEATHVTGFPELDDLLRVRLAAFKPPPGECIKVTLVASHFECETEKTLD